VTVQCSKRNHEGHEGIEGHEEGLAFLPGGATLSARKGGPMSRTAVALGVGAAILWTMALSAQSKRLAFEVASVRAYSTDDGPFRHLNRTTEARVDRIRTVGMLLGEAFRQPNLYRIAAPDWVNEVMVEIQATMPPGATAQQVPEMLQTLLEERLGLVTHLEARPMDAYELVVAPGGVKMKEVEALNELDKDLPPDPSTGVPQREIYSRDTPDGIVRMFQVLGGGFTRMTSRTLYERRTVHNEGSIITAARMSVAELVTELETNLDMPVVDRTGLAGLYMFTLRLPYDAALMRLDAMILARLGQHAGAAGVVPGGSVSLSRELDRLGLKLEKRRVPIDVIVVDKISRTPTAN
jgi:uncharacterized protein (TIGR03435 family)